MAKICRHCEEEHDGVCVDEVSLRMEELDDEIKRLYSRLNCGDVSWDTANELHADNCHALRKCHTRLTNVLKPLYPERIAAKERE